jgi:hypothetical protein
LKEVSRKAQPVADDLEDEKSWNNARFRRRRLLLSRTISSGAPSHRSSL